MTVPFVCGCGQCEMCHTPVDGHPRVPMNRVISWELDVLGSHGMAAADYPGMMALIEQGRCNLNG